MNPIRQPGIYVVDTPDRPHLVRIEVMAIAGRVGLVWSYYGETQVYESKPPSGPWWRVETVRPS